MADVNISGSIPVASQQQVEKMVQQGVVQVDSDDDINQYLDYGEFGLNQLRRFKDLPTHLSPKMEEQEDVVEEKIQGVEKPDEAAARFQRNNYELNSSTLLILRSQLKSTDTPEEVLEKVLKVYSDPALADEALDFLFETAENPTIQAAVRAAKDILNTGDRGREVRAGRNMGAQAREFSKEGLGSATSLRDLYREITGNPREPVKLFDELSDKFDYPKLKPVITFLLHSLGSDLKSKGPSIDRAELKRLIDETRSLQGILGVFRFFQSRMQLISRLFSSYNLIQPNRLDFEVLAKTLIKLLAERYMNPEKILQTAKQLGISEEAAAQLIIYTQMREALRQIAPRYYRNPQHRDELAKAFLDVLDRLEDELEDEEEEEK